MRVLFFAGYTHPYQSYKIELLANEPDVELVHITGVQSGKTAGLHSSANGQRSYKVKIAGHRSLSKHGDAHRAFGWPPFYGLTEFKPHLIHYEGEIESLGAAQIVLLRSLLARQAKLVLTTWQNILRPRRWYVKLINNLNMHAAQHILCANQEGITVLKQQGYQGASSVITTIGVDTRFFYPKPVPELRQKLGLQDVVIGYVGRLVPEKGIDTLLLAAAQAHYPTQLLFVGTGPEKENLQLLAQQLNIGDKCQFIDAVSYESIADYINLFDLLVLPSRTTEHWKEQFGRVLIEAMACKVAVVGSDSGAIPEVISSYGRIFPEGNVAALATIIDELASHAALRKSLGEQGYQYALATYSVEQIAQKTLSVWCGLLS